MDLFNLEKEKNQGEGDKFHNLQVKFSLSYFVE